MFGLSGRSDARLGGDAAISATKPRESQTGVLMIPVVTIVSLAWYRIPELKAIRKVLAENLTYRNAPARRMSSTRPSRLTIRHHLCRPDRHLQRGEHRRPEDPRAADKARSAELQVTGVYGPTGRFTITD